MRWSVFLLFWGVLPVSGQVQTKAIENHNGGLVTYFSGNRIDETQCVDVVNGVFDRDNAVVKRKGSALYGTVTSCSNPIPGGWDFTANTGQDYFFIICGSSLHVTTGGGTFAVHGGTMASTTVNFVRSAQVLGKRWFTNGNDYVFNTDGVDVSTATSVPRAKLLGGFKSRLVAANYPGFQSTVFLSGYRDGTDYTIPAVQVDTSPVQFFLNGSNDGRVVTCLFDGFRDTLILWNEDQTWALYGNGVNTFTLRQLSNHVGCVSQETVKEHTGVIRWMSKRGIEEFDGAQIKKISLPIQDLIEDVVFSESNQQSLVQTTQSDWENGNVTAAGNGAPMSVTVSPGNVVPSTWTIHHHQQLATVWTSTSHVSTFSAAGYLSLIQSTFSFHNGNFGDSNFANWTTAGTWSITGNAGTDGCGQGASLQATPTTSSSASRTSKLDILDADNNILKTCTVTWSCSGGICSHVSNTCDTQASIGASGGTFGMYVADYTRPTVKVRITDNDTGSTLISIASHTAYGVAVRMNTYLDASSLNAIGYRGCAIQKWRKPGVYVSKSFDTFLSTPTWGPLDVIMSSDSVATVTLQTQVSDDDATWDTEANTVNNAKPHSDQRRYIRYVLNLNTTSETKSPLISTVTLNASTTGQYITNCFNPGTSISSWGLIQANTVLDSATIDLYVSTGPTCHAVTRTTVTWNAQTNNVTIAVATAAFLGVRADFISISTGVTQLPKLQDVTINFAIGTDRPPLAATTYDNRYWLSLTTSTLSTATNDTVVVYDSLGKWTMFKGINASSFWQFQRRLYSGSSASDGKVYLQDTGTSDAGSNILFKLRTPDLNLGHVGYKHFFWSKTELDAVDASQASTMTVRYFIDRGTTPYNHGSVYLGSDSSFILSRHNFQQNTSPTTGRLLSLEYSDNSTSPLKLYRSIIQFLALPLP